MCCLGKDLFVGLKLFTHPPGELGGKTECRAPGKGDLQHPLEFPCLSAVMPSDYFELHSQIETDELFL